MHNVRLDGDISHTLTPDLSEKSVFPEASDLHFMLALRLQICHYGQPKVKPQITCRAKITCPAQSPQGAMAHRPGMKKSDRKRTSGAEKKKKN